MDAAGWAKLKEWFGAVLESSPEQVQDILGQAERESPELARELRALIAGHDAPRAKTDRIRPDPVRGVEAMPLGIAVGGSLMGPYRLLRELGRGGTGIVFLAERADDEFHRPVALKVLRYIAWDRHSQELLTAERRVLSQLQHGNIASLLDWGATPDGIPWLATEFVAGEPIDTYCATRGLSVTDALGIFEQVCEAVQYAHRRLVVHRDLKPANILVTESGTVKLLDFSISKPLEDPTVTREADRRFTPAYASPEQIEGLPISAASDVYSLGLLLYEILTGSLPNGSGTVQDLARRLELRELPPPSGVTGIDKARRRLIRGDLDRIILRATARSVDQRYPSVEQLLADVRAHVAGYPIGARGAGPVERFTKFVRRNALSVAAVLLAVCGLLGATAWAAWNAREARREQQAAERRFGDLRSLAHTVMFDLHDTIRRVPGSVEARRVLITTAMQYLDTLAAENINDDALQMELAAGYARMGYVQGGAAGVNLGETAGAQRSYRSALEILDAQWARRPWDEQVGALRFAAAYNLSMMMGDPAEGVAFARRYAAEASTWSKQNDGAPPLQALELLHSALGRTRRNTGDFAGAIAEFEAAAAFQQRMLPKTARDSDARPMFSTSVDYAQGIFDSGLTAFAKAEALLAMDRPRDALQSIQNAASLFDQGTRLGRSGPSDRRMAARTRTLHAAILMAMGDLRQAQALADRGIRDAEANTTDGSATSRRDLAEAHRVKGLILAGRDPAAGESHLLEATRGLSRLVALDPVFVANRVMLARALNDYADTLIRAGKDGEAEMAARRARDTANESLLEAPSWADLYKERARASGTLALGAKARRAAEAPLLQASAERDWSEHQRRLTGR